LNAPITSIGNSTLQFDTVAGATTGKGPTLAKGCQLNAGTVQVGSPALPNNAIAKATFDMPPGGTRRGLNVSGDQAQKQGTVDHLAGDENLSGRLQIGHWPSETSTYNLNGGNVNLTALRLGHFLFPPPFLSNKVAFYLGIDGTGIFNQSGGTLSTNFIVLDNRG
jgi:hypothetical protein